ncbi:MAG TPA: Crp/Fnr family transcriptional regulator [Acidobacteriaceae bacterium]|jgi:CRP/FNR family transcriptional regulator
MFCGMSPDNLAAFDQLGVQMAVPKGTVLFQENEPAAMVAVLCAGQVKLSCTSRAGKTLILKIASPGNVLGLGAVISGTPYEVTAEALEPVTLKNIRKAEFLAFLAMHGEASMHAARSLSEDYKSAFFDVRRLALAPSAAGRIATVLLDWGRSVRCEEGQLHFTMALTHEELANLAGTSRETVTRVLGRLVREKLIRINGAVVTLLEPEKLAALG